MKSLLIVAIGISMGILMSRLKNAEFAKRLNGFIFEEQNADEEKVSTDEAKAADSETDQTKSAESKTDEAKSAEPKTDETNSAKAELAESKTDEADSAESKTDETDSAESKTDETDSEELPDFLEYELNQEKKRLKMMRKTSLKMVEKSFDKLEKTAEFKTKSKAKDIEAETDEYVIFSMNKLNNPQSQYSPYIDKNDANSKKN